MLFAEVIPDASEKLSEVLKQASDAKWYRRLKIIQLSSQQTSVLDVATLFDLCTATIRDYIKRYNAHGLAGLKRQSSDGAPPKIPLTKAKWEALLHQIPSQFDRLERRVRGTEPKPWWSNTSTRITPSPSPNPPCPCASNSTRLRGIAGP